MIKVDWLAAGVSTKREWRLISKFSLLFAYCLQNPPANGKQEQVTEEMSQTLLTNKKQGKKYKVQKLLALANLVPQLPKEVE